MSDLRRAGHNGGEPNGHIPLARPNVPAFDEVAERVRAILASGFLTNGATVRELEERVSERVSVRHCIAVSSCTTGLVLVLRASGIRGDVIVPSFTFPAGVHAVAWNGLRPIFVDCDPVTLTLPADVIAAATHPRTSAVLATHVFGTPCDVDGIADVSCDLGLRVFYDSAHAFGSTSLGRPIGSFGDAEVFSLTPTKPLIAGEGGLITTNDDELAHRCRIGRDYGNPGDYDCEFVGLNARMSEFHAAVALASLDTLDERVEQRRAVAAMYRRRLSGSEAVSFPELRAGDQSTYKDFTVLLAPGVDRALVADRLAASAIETRTYYHPPVHRQKAYSQNGWGSPSCLPVTDDVAGRVLTLPLWETMDTGTVDAVCSALEDSLA